MPCSIRVLRSVFAAVVILGQGLPAQSPRTSPVVEVDRAVRAIVESIAPRLNGKTVAVLDFPHIERGVSALSNFVSERMTTALVQHLAGTGRVLERRQVLQVLRELRLQGASLSADEANLLGKRLNADIVVLGSLTVLGTDLDLSGRAVSVTSRDVLAAESVTIRMTAELTRLAETRSTAPIGSDEQQTASTPTADPVPTSTKFHGRDAGVTIDLHACTAGSGALTCRFTVTSERGDGYFFFLLGTIVDRTGAKIEADDIEFRGSAGRQVELVEKTPLTWTLRFPGVPATGPIARLQITFSYNVDYSSDGRVTFRNVPWSVASTR